MPWCATPAPALRAAALRNPGPDHGSAEEGQPNVATHHQRLGITQRERGPVDAAAEWVVDRAPAPGAGTRGAKSVQDDGPEQRAALQVRVWILGVEPWGGDGPDNLAL